MEAPLGDGGAAARGGGGSGGGGVAVVAAPAAALPVERELKRGGRKVRVRRRNKHDEFRGGLSLDCSR